MTIHSEPPAGYTTARANDNEIVREALRILDQQLRATDEIFLTSPSTVRDYLCLQLVARECEIFAEDYVLYFLLLIPKHPGQPGPKAF